MTARVLTGDCLVLLPALEADSVDAIVCDPPYGLGFMGKAWDTFSPEAVQREMRRDTRSQKRRALYGGKESNAPSAAMAAARYDGRRDDDFEEFMFAVFLASWRVAKPGAHLVAFGSPRRHHRLMCAIEDAGWEIRDCLSWLYGSGFPKSHNGEWGGTALKPGWEPIILARKPLIGTVASNVTEHGTGALNIDGCRIGFANEADQASAFPGGRTTSHGAGALAGPGAAQDAERSEFAAERNDRGRWPANVVLDEDAAALLDEQSGTLTSGGYPPAGGQRSHRSTYGAPNERGEPLFGASLGGASRFFYCAKASRSERDAGLTGERKPLNWSDGTKNPGSFQSAGTDRSARNYHPTVKPIALMRWLCRLVTPPKGLILDPFTGSGSTGCAAVLEGFQFLGCELSEEYAEIARARIAHAAANHTTDLWGEAV